MEYKLTRRNFLDTMIVGAGLIFSQGCQSKNSHSEEFTRFPNFIPGAKEIKKFSVENANYCLVHIRQKHHVDFDPNNPSDKIFGEHKPTKQELEKINSHQKSVYEILNFLKKDEVIDSVYLEGIDSETLIKLRKIKMIPEDEELTRELNDLEFKLRQEIIWDTPEGYTQDTIREEYKNKLEELKESITGYEKKYKYYYGGGLRLVLEKKIEPRFENLSLHDKAYEEIVRTGKVGRIVLDDREDSILHSIVQNKEKIAVVPFGGVHAWGGKESCGKDYDLQGRKSYKDNIAEWNKKYPDKKFCLIEIIPEEY